jgi:cell division protein FtsW
VILYLAAWLSSRGKKNVGNFYEGFVPFVGVMGLVSFLIYKQPDIGTLGLIAIIALTVFFAAGATVKHIVIFTAVSAAGLYAIIRSATYRWDRFMVFLDPGLDPQGKGYQISQALLAIGSGGLLGLGLGNSRQKFNYLPEPVGDSVFAIIGEELGLIGCFLVIVAFIILAYRGYKIASHAPDEFGRLMAVGITSWIIFQALINISAIVALIPLTGMPLPFISYGGTSLVFSLAAMGILLNIGKQSKM